MAGIFSSQFKEADYSTSGCHSTLWFMRIYTQINVDEEDLGKENYALLSPRVFRLTSLTLKGNSLSEVTLPFLIRNVVEFVEMY